MTDSASGLHTLLRMGRKLALALYDSPSDREELIEYVRAMAADETKVTEVSDAEEIFEDALRDSLVVFGPSDPERDFTVLQARRDQLLERNAPVLIVLPSASDAFRELQKHEALVSWLAGPATFPATESTDPAETERAFVEAHGCTPAEWLKAWRDRRLADSVENNLTLAVALLLEGER